MSKRNRDHAAASRVIRLRAEKGLVCGKTGQHRFLLFVAVITVFSFFAPVHAQQPLNARSSPSLGSALFASNCAACHGSDGRGGERAPDIATASDVQQFSTGDLIGIVSNGISGAGMPAFGFLGPQKVRSIVDYLRLLQGSGSLSKLPGDPGAGKVLFFGKAQCSSCHMVRGKGGFIASDLTRYGVDRTVDQIRNIITDPDKYLSPRSKPVTVVTRSGQSVTGMMRTDDNFSISIQTMNGSFHFFQKSDLKHIDFGSHSLMPGDYASKLSDQELNDLISYLMNVGRESATHKPE